MQCDEAQPECGQCLRTGRRCPGATVGMFFINISPDTEVGLSQPSRLPIPRDNRFNAASEPSMSTRRSEESSRNAGHTDERTLSGSIALLGRPGGTLTQTTDATTLAVSMEDFAHMKLPQWYQPSKADIFQQHFTAHFIGNFFNPSSYLTKINLWVYHIPAIIYSSPSPAVKCSIRATTMAFYGTKAGDVALQTEASRWYGKGLSQQRTELEQIATYPHSQQLKITTLLAPLMFAMFETVMVTSATGWAQHLYAASRILELLGPEAFQDGVANSLFRSIRMGLVRMIALYWL